MNIEKTEAEMKVFKINRNREILLLSDNLRNSKNYLQSGHRPGKKNIKEEP
jgi:hypothetical protein